MNPGNAPPKCIKIFLSECTLNLYTAWSWTKFCLYSKSIFIFNDNECMIVNRMTFILCFHPWSSKERHSNHADVHFKRRHFRSRKSAFICIEILKERPIGVFNKPELPYGPYNSVYMTPSINLNPIKRPAIVHTVPRVLFSRTRLPNSVFISHANKIYGDNFH